jgi:hypothetical protein
MALTLVGCGIGSVHPGQKARIGSLGFGCTELVDAKHAAAFLGPHESAEHMNAAFFLTDPPRCLKLYSDEILAVTAEDGDYRQVHRQNGMDLGRVAVFEFHRHQIGPIAFAPRPRRSFRSTPIMKWQHDRHLDA